MSAASGRQRLGAAFWRFWSVELATGTGVGLAIIALQTMLVEDLGGGAAEVGWLAAARWLPYVVLGLVAGALVEGWRRRTAMLASDLARATILGALAAAWLLGGGELWALLLAALALGAASLVNDAASQAFVPRLVPRPLLLAAHQRLDLGANAAQSAGPAASGALIAWLGAPVSLLVAAAAHLASAVVLATMPVDEPVRTSRPPLWRSIGRGLRFVHRHPRLGPFARWTHAWFLCNGAAMTLLVPLVLTGLSAGPAGLGLALGALGAATLAGTALAEVVAGRAGEARTIVLSRVGSPLGWALVALPALVPMAPPAGLAVVVAGLVVAGVGMGLGNPSEMALRQRATPDAMQARMNATMRTANRGMIVVAAPIAGIAADALGLGPVLAVVVVGFALSAAGLARSPLARRRAR